VRRNEYIKGSKKPKYKAEFPWRRSPTLLFCLRCELPIYKHLLWIITLERTGNRKNQNWHVAIDIRKNRMLLKVATGKSQASLRNAIKEAERLYKNIKKRF